MADVSSIQGIPAPEGTAAIIETDYEMGQDNIQRKLGPFGLDFHNPVFVISGLSVVAVVLFAIILPDQAASFFEAVKTFVLEKFDWFFLSAANVFVVFCLALIISPYGSVRLGGTDATPDYGYVGWFAMLFAAGMGIGLLFFGVAEPMTHFDTALGGTVAGEGGARTDWAPLGAASGDPEAAQSLGMAATILHWGLHPWALYSVVALALALFSYNKGLPLTLRSTFYPLLGDRVWGWWGHIIDTLAVFATLFGLATSLGFGAEQAAAGLAFLYGSGDAAEGTRSFLGITYGNDADSGVENDPMLLILLITGITAIALISVVRGIDGGVKRLSELNMGLAGILMLFVIFVTGPVFLAVFFFDSLYAYAVNLLPLSQPVARDDVNYSQGWTAFYWAWWISWSPFVGMFIARVSRGRTVREFLICVMLIPTSVCVVWMSVFGGAALNQFVADGYEGAKNAALELKLFYMLSELPLATITSTVGIVLVIVFFVTSSDSGSLVIDTITAGGKVDAPVSQRVFWCIFEGAVAIALLIGGGLGSLQAAVISTGLPFSLMLLFMCFAILKGLATEAR
ncbi:MAG: BCCT family transporter [Loktanella sp.]|nr:BCCT family transporter [Loktanella sp.]